MSEKDCPDVSALAAAPELSNEQCYPSGGAATLTVDIKFVLSATESIDDGNVFCSIGTMSADSITHIASGSTPQRFEKFRATFNSVDCDTTHTVRASGTVFSNTPESTVDVDCPECDETERGCD